MSVANMPQFVDKTPHFSRAPDVTKPFICYNIRSCMFSPFCTASKPKVFGSKAHSANSLNRNRQVKTGLQLTQPWRSLKSWAAHLADV